MRLAMMTDAHANLPALEAALAAIRAEGYDLLVHTGDAIAIGPHPRECVELLLSTPKARCLMGNHESYYVDGLPEPRPDSMSAGEALHQCWVREQLGPHLRPILAGWPYLFDGEFEGVHVAFLHYALDATARGFQGQIADNDPADLDRAFEAQVAPPASATLVCYGHRHSASDVQARARYVRPGSLGVHDRAIARYCVADCTRGRFTLVHRAVPYDDGDLWPSLQARDVPARAFIWERLFGRPLP